MVLFKNYKVKKISVKTGINFRKFSEGNFRTHNPTADCKVHKLAVDSNTRRTDCTNVNC